MLKTALAAVAMTCAFGVVAAKADFYVVQNSSTKECKVVETKPTETTWVQIGPMAFKTRDEATRQITTICKEKR
jgi:hypothetical protein